MTTRTPPKHGERRCYLRGCRQPECVAANKRYCKQSDLRRHTTGPTLIDATPVIEHLRRYVNEGWPRISLADETGCNPTTIIDLLNGDQTKIRRQTAARILAFNPPLTTEPGGFWTDATGTMRRLRALAVLGYNLDHIAAELGQKRSTLVHIRTGTRQKVSKTLARKIAAYYTTRIHTLGPSYVARGIAKNRGWHGPLAWDDIDDPNAVPDVDGGAEPELKRDQLAALRRTEIEHLAAFGVSEHDIATRLDMAPKSVHQILAEIRTGTRRNRNQKQEAAA